MLHSPTPDGGLGFCHDALPQLLARGVHSPLVVALDSNILIDLQIYGSALLDDEILAEGPAIDRKYRADLDGLAEILNIWLLRDIRFIATPRSKTDAKKGVTTQFLAKRIPTIEGLARSLAYQYGVWETAAPSEFSLPRATPAVGGLPSGADLDLIEEARAVGAHVFLTRDQIVLDRAVIGSPSLALFSPSSLAAVLLEAKVGLFAGGTCGLPGCPYMGHDRLAPDMGKWEGLLSIFD